MAAPLTTAEPNSVIIDQGLVYCRFPDGSIIPCDASPMELMKKINRGIQVLNDYGQFGSNAYYMEHPFEPLLQAGGAREFTVQQIVELGYHLRPPLIPTCEQHVGMSKDHLSHTGRPLAGSAKAQGCWRGARPAWFPQLEGVDLPEAPEPCDAPGCDRGDFPTIEARRQHQSVMHADLRQQRELGDAIVAGLQRSGVISGGNAHSAEAIATAVAATLRALGYGTTPGQQPDPGPNPPDEPEDEGDEPPSEPQPLPEPPPAPAASRRR